MIIVLAYHSVADIEYSYSVSPEIFEKQMRLLRRKCKIVDMAGLGRMLHGADPWPHKTVAVVTFDDGLRNNYDVAYPILQRLGIPATVFVSTGLVDGTFPAQGNAFPMLSWKEIEEMDRGGLMTIGAHTHSHTVLTTCGSERVREELVTSQTLLEQHLHHAIPWMAYPKGACNETVKRLANEYYEIAFAPHGMISSPLGVDTMSLPRVTMTRNLPFWKFQLMLNPVFLGLKSWQIRRRSSLKG